MANSLSVAHWKTSKWSAFAGEVVVIRFGQALANCELFVREPLWLAELLHKLCSIIAGRTLEAR
jgi:hypothetical protein